jgi:hypothetical protein
MERGLGGRVRHAVRGLTPGYFALVMATGIESVGLDLVDHRTLSVLLLWVAGATFVALLILNIWRLIGFREAVVDDFEDPRRAFGFLTVIAGTNVLGVRLGAEHLYQATAVLFVVALVLWLGLGYIVPWTAVLSCPEWPLVASANGTRFIWVVAAQSVAVAAATLEPGLPALAVGFGGGGSIRVVRGCLPLRGCWRVRGCPDDALRVPAHGWRGWLVAVALPAWTIVFIAMVVNTVRTVLQPRGVLTLRLPPRPSAAATNDPSRPGPL